VTFVPRDTTPEAWAIVEEGIRRMTAAERVQRAVALTVLAHRFALAKIRAQYPDEDDRRHRLRLAARYLDEKTIRALESG
jgi:hypothetical protein